MPVGWDDQTEWLETDSLGGFACGTVGGIRTRRYHGLLVAAPRQPSARVMLVNGLEVFVTTAAGRWPLSSQRYDGQVIFPEGFRHIESFATEPWPTWRFRLPDGTRIEQQICMRDGQSLIAITWRLINPTPGARLEVRPLLSGRDYHALHHENADFRFDATEVADRITWQPYAAHPPIVARSNGVYHHEPFWYRNFFYQEEWLRGFDATEDLASPGYFTWQLGEADAVLVLQADTGAMTGDAATIARRIMRREAERRLQFASPLERAADQYIVRKGDGKTIIAGYPWFGDWGRDSFIALRGLCLARGRYDAAGDILLQWSRYISRGMLPNRFPDAGEEPEYNSVDAALWYVIATQELLAAAKQGRFHLWSGKSQNIDWAIESILAGYAAVAHSFGIRADNDGLLAAGEEGWQLTWMDARLNGRCITPRIGKPVEVQALWINALWAAGADDQHWHDLCSKAYTSFRDRFWNPQTGGLFDVIDCHHRRSVVDPTFRPNQIFAVGGLPLVLLEPDRARSVVDQVEKRLWTAMGLRSLAPQERGYAPQYTGNSEWRDSAYHQGTVWPWLIGPCVEAWIRVRGRTDAARVEAREKFVEPLQRHLAVAGLNHVSEIADADAPHMPRGCPFQAWSVAELLRAESLVSVVPKLTLNIENTSAMSNEPLVASGHPICG